MATDDGIAAEGTARTAQIWVDTNGGSCVRRTPPARYVDATACRTLRQAYRAAWPGDMINVRDGVYGSDVFDALDKPVTVRAAGPGRPSFGVSNFAGAGVTIRGLKFELRGGTTADDDWVCHGPPPAGRGLSGQLYMNGIVNSCATNITFDDVEIDGLRNPGTPGNCSREGIKLMGDGFTFKNGSIHGIYDRKGADLDAANITIANTVFYDIRVRNVCYADVHNECIYIPRAEGAVFRSNKFIECPTMALFFSGNPDTDSDNVTIEGNLFTHTVDASGDWHSAPCALKIGAGPSRINGWIVRYNTFETTPCNDNLPAGAKRGEWYGNLGGAGCIAGFEYHHNVGETCGGADSVAVRTAANTKANRNQTPFYVNAPAGVFLPRAGSVAINRGDPRRFPRTDAAGERRRLGPAPDAGAYEYVPITRAASRSMTIQLTGSGRAGWTQKGGTDQYSQSLAYNWKGALTFRVPTTALKSPHRSTFRAIAGGVLSASWSGSLDGRATAGAYRCTYRGEGVAAPVTATLRNDGRPGVLELMLVPRRGAALFFPPSGKRASSSCTTPIGRAGPLHFSPGALFRETAAVRGFLTTSAAIISFPSDLLSGRQTAVTFPRDAGRHASQPLGTVNWTNRGLVVLRRR